MKHPFYLQVLLVSTGLLLCSFSATAQLIVQWDKTLGGIGPESLRKVVATPDGGYLVAGRSSSTISGEKTEDPIGGCDNRGCYYGDYDTWIVKIDENGNKQWDKTIGTDESDVIEDIIRLPEGGYLLGGRSSFFDDFWLLNMDERGNILWEKTYGGNGSDALYNITPTLDGGYLLAGRSSSKASGDKSENSRGKTDFWVVKIDKHGNQLWDKTLGGNDWENEPHVIATPDGGYLIGGSSDSDASGDKTEDNTGGDQDRDYWVVKIDGNGNKLWDKIYGTPDWQYFHNIVATRDGNYLLTGITFTAPGSDYTIIKIDGDGSQLWMKSYGHHNAQLGGAIATDDGNYLLLGWMSGDAPGGSSEINRGRTDYWALKIDSDGNRLWDEMIGGNWHDNPADIITTPDGGYLLAGNSRSDAIADKSESRRGDYDYWVVKVVEGEDEEKEVKFAVGGFDLVNANTDQVLHPLIDGSEVNLYNLDLYNLEYAELTVRANTYPVNIEKVEFELSGPITHIQTEHNWPYALFGDNLSFFFRERNYLGKEWPVGEYTLTATPYFEGEAGSTHSITFTVVDRPPATVVSFVLVNADTDQDIRRLKDGDVVDLAVLGNPQLSIRTNTTPVKIDRIELSLAGPLSHTQTESGWPYALFGDSPKAGRGRDYIGRDWKAGNYTLIATPYENNKKGAAASISFTVTDNSNNARMAVEVYPVPTTGVVNITHEGITEKGQMMLLDYAGNILLEQPLSRQTEQLDLSSFRKGFYYLKVASKEDVQVRRILLE